jgi:hypothetical protein
VCVYRCRLFILRETKINLNQTVFTCAIFIGLVSIMTRLKGWTPGALLLAGTGIFLFATAFRSALGST